MNGEKSMNQCPCRKCLEEAGITKTVSLTGENLMTLPGPNFLPQFYGMIVCPTCGNKRCPHATDHNCDCTGSNEPGQEGSIYG